MPIPASVFWHAPSPGAPGRLVGMHGDTEAEFETIQPALAWARGRASQVVVSIEGLGSWEQPPGEREQAEIDAYIQRSRERGRREALTYPEPVEWFFAVLGPDTAEPEQLAVKIAEEPGILGARVHRQMHRGDEELWLVLRLLARSWIECANLATDALDRYIWPDDRLAREFGDASYVVSAGRHQEFGLAEYESDVLKPDGAPA